MMGSQSGGTMNDGCRPGTHRPPARRGGAGRSETEDLPPQTIADATFEPSPVLVFPAVHLGYRFAASCARAPALAAVRG